MKKRIILLTCLILIFSVIMCFIVLKTDESNKYKSDYKLSYDINDTYDKDVIFSSYTASLLEENNLIKEDLFNYGDIIDKDKYINVYNKPTLDAKSEVEDFFGVENDFFDDIKEENISYSYFLKSSLFPFQFDIEDKYFGMNKSSETGLFSIVKVNYYLDNENYSMSIFDEDNNELIYMKSNSFKDKTYLQIYYEFIDNKSNNAEEIYFGEDEFDSALFPVTNIIVEDFINDDTISNYYCGGRINIQGTGTFFGVENKIDKNNIKYNFSTNSILFIVKENCMYPNLIIPCN